MTQMATRHDYRGWNVVSQNDDITGTATLHGNGVAGIIGAAGNNSKGIAGVNWRVKMMLVAGGNTIAGIIAACDYIRMNRKLNNETGGQKAPLWRLSILPGGSITAFRPMHHSGVKCSI
jgi:subtilisin family serine protease